MRSVLLLPLVVLAACAAKDDRPLVGGGGGGGGHGSGSGDDPDAGTPADGGAELLGEVCVVVDLADPFKCQDVAADHGVLVTQVGGTSTHTNSLGEFSMAADKASVVLEVGAEAGDGLLTTRYPAVAAASPLAVPVVDQTLWEDMLITLAETQTTGAMLIYVVDANGPVTGATVSYVAGGHAGARLYYDDGVGGFDPNATSTGPDGIALILDTNAASMRATGSNGSATVDVPTIDGGVGVALIVVP